MEHPELPMAGAAPAERTDAARNRARLLDAADRLIRGRGADAVTIDAVAAAACVGKGTVFRRFGNRAGLLRALLDRHERDLQQAFLFGPPPLGPGATPAERLVAFGLARIDLVVRHGELLRAADRDTAGRYGNAPRQVSLTHVRTLLRAAGVDADVAMLAEALVAALDAGLLLHLLRDESVTVDRIRVNWADLVRRVVGCHDDAGPALGRGGLHATVAEHPTTNAARRHE